MKTATGLALVAIGAILAFAVTGHPGWLNVQAAGWVLILVGLAGMFVPRRGYGWLKRRMVVRRPAAGRRAVLTSGGLTSGGLANATALPAGTVVLTPEQAAEVQAGALEPEPEVFPGRQLSKAEAEAQMTPASPLTSTSETIEEYLEE
jgi:membrane protease YdiL (CAAX protease family)